MIKRCFVVFAVLMCFSCSAWAQDYTVYDAASLDAVQIDSQEISIPLQPSDTSDDVGGAAVFSDEQIIAVNSVYTVYDSGLPSSVYLDWAKGLIKRVPIGLDYVFFRSGQYQYVFAYGDYSNGFSAPSTVYVLQLATNYNGSYSFYSMSDAGFNLNPGQGIVYSSLSDYPSLSDNYSREILFCLILFGCCYTVMYLMINAFKSMGF